MAEPMKIRARRQGDVADVMVLMNHPMETGQRKDAKTGDLIPAHYIQTVSASLNGKNVVEGQLGVAISKNPFFGFKIRGAKAGDKVAITWVDNKGDTNTAEAAIV